MVNKISNLFYAGTRCFLQIAVPWLLIGGLCVLINLYDPAILDSTMEAIKHHPRTCFLLRLGILCAFIFCLPSMVLKIGQRGGAKKEQIEHWEKEAWRIGLWLILVELLVCENIISKAIHLLGSL